MVHPLSHSHLIYYEENTARGWYAYSHILTQRLYSSPLFNSPPTLTFLLSTYPLSHSHSDSAALLFPTEILGFMPWLFVSSFDVSHLPSLLSLGIYSRKLLHSLSKKALFTSSVNPFPLYSIRMDWYCMHWLDSFIIIMIGFRCIDWSNYQSIKAFLLLLKSEQSGITPLWVEAFSSGTKWGNLFWKIQILNRGPHCCLGFVFLTGSLSETLMVFVYDVL